jgi:hypothetical protein
LSKTLRAWLQEIAKAVEKWATMPKNSVEVAISVSSPLGAVMYIVNKHVPAEDREAVCAALPDLNTDDFAVAAQRIRQAAATLRE